MNTTIEQPTTDYEIVTDSDGSDGLHDFYASPSDDYEGLCERDGQ